MTVDIEAKRAEAKKFKGVTYDVARGQFMAQIQRGAKRTTLGRYDTAQEASDVYEAERKAKPAKRHGKGPSYRLPRPSAPKKDNSLVRHADELALWLGELHEQMPLDQFNRELWEVLVRQYPDDKGTGVYGGMSFETMCNRIRADSWRAKRYSILGGVVGFIDPEEEIEEPSEEQAVESEQPKVDS